MAGQPNGGLQIFQTLLLTVLLGLSGWVLWTVHDHSLQLADIKGEVTRASVHRWSSVHMSLWANEMKQQNPTLTIPDPGEISRTVDP